MKTQLFHLLFCFAAAVIFFLPPVISLGQDTHYNTYQFGTRSALLGGAVLGYTRDNTCIFYNPGSLAFVDSNSITITANAYQVENYRIKSANSLQKDLTSSPIGSVPLMVAGMLGLGKKRIRIGYGVISPVNFDFKTTSRIAGRFSVVDEQTSPGDEEFVGQSSISSQLNEVAGILGIGYKLNENWAIGLSNMGVGRSQDFSKATYARYYLNNPENSLCSYSSLRSANYFHLRYVGKIGLSYLKKGFAFGFTVTLPSIGVFGTGVLTGDFIGTNILYNDSRTSVLANARQEKVSVVYSSPFSLASGINWRINKSTLGFSLQYHARKDAYEVMSAVSAGILVPTALFESLGGRDFLTMKEGARQVLNFSLGYEYALYRNVSLIASFRSNQSFHTHELDGFSGIKTSISTWNIYHFSGGLILKQGHSQLTIGLMYGTGSDGSRTQNGEFSIPQEVRFSDSDNSTSRATYNSIGFLLGYSFMLFDL